MMITYRYRIIQKPFFLTASLFALALLSCSNRSMQREAQESQPKDTITTFTLPGIPQMLMEPELRADYLVKHYWDLTNLADSNYAHHPELMEQAWVNYIDLFRLVSPEQAVDGLKGLMKRAESSPVCFKYFCSLADNYLYDANSPMRNEELYITVLDAQLASDCLSEEEKNRPRYRRLWAEKNRKGHVAADFTYTLASGQQGTLHDIPTRYTLLFLNNPGCHACGETIELLQQAQAVNRLLKKRLLTVLSVYPDEELEEWKRHQADYPRRWINAYDKNMEITNHDLYDLRAIPTLYLLDTAKRVILKDATVEQVEDYLDRKNKEQD